MAKSNWDGMTRDSKGRLLPKQVFPILSELYERHVIRHNVGCWEWSGSKVTGYGYITTGNQRTYAHRFSWSVANGPIPNGLVVMHTCDNHQCTRPDHLALGSQADNLADMKAKGRNARGSKHGRSKLTEDIVLQILHATGSTADIGKKYGISQQHASLIRRGGVWQSLQGAMKP